MRKIMGDGCWLQFPQRLREPGPGSGFEFPPPTEYCIVLCGPLAKYIQWLWPFGQINDLCGLLAQVQCRVSLLAQWPCIHCICLKNKTILWNLFSYLRSVAVLLCARCKCGHISTIRPLAKTVVTTKCSLGDFLRKTESFGSVWVKDCEESSEGRIEEVLKINGW